MTVPDYVAAVRACPRVLVNGKPAFIIDRYKVGVRVVPEWVLYDSDALADLSERSTIDDLRAYTWVDASIVSPVDGEV
jgi:hypothetical protein